MPKSKYKKRYVIFVLTVIVTIIINEVLLQYKLSLQQSDAKVINIAGRQRMLSQRIAKHLLYMGNNTKQLGKTYTDDTLRTLVKEFEKAHLFLKQNKLTNKETNKLLLKTDPLIASILESGKKTGENPSESNIQEAISNLSKVELPFLFQMENIVAMYQQEAEKKLSTTINLALVLSGFTILILIAEFLFIINPFFNDLLVKNKALVTANRRLSDFAYITSHNLRAPISNLTGLMDLVQEEEDEEEKNGLLDRFKTVIQNLNSTMDTLGEAIKTLTKKEYALEDINLEGVLQKTVEGLSSKIHDKSAIIKHDFSGLKSVVYDKMYLESLFYNLIDNALKYQSLERNPEITIYSKKKKGSAQLTFKDNGLGIDMERHGEKLFGLNKTFHRHPEANGVGLFMTRTQVEALGGTITAKSIVNEGTTFTITL